MKAQLCTATAIALMTACGSTPTGDPASAAMFVGKWTAQPESTETDNCGTQSQTTGIIGTVTVSLPAPNSGNIVTLAANGCALNWVANGNVATLAGSQVCTVGDWRATFTKGTLTLGTNLIDLQDQGNGILTDNGATQSCTFTQSGSFKNN
jgi:hypothetical protein